MEDKKKRKICIVTGNRAEYSRLKTVMDGFKKYLNVEVLLVAMGSHLLDNFGNTADDINIDGNVIDYKIFIELEGGTPCTMARAIGFGICDLSTYFDNKKPDIVIAPMDRYEILSVAAAAALMNIPVAHMQGGEVSGTIDESIRHTITKLSHIHFPATEKSKERIIRMGERPDMVWNVGDPATDVLLVAPQYTGKETIEELNRQIIKDKKIAIDPSKPFILSIQHPVTTEFGSGLAQIKESFMALKNFKDFNVILLIPNIDAGGNHILAGIREFVSQQEIKNLALLKHVPHDIFVNLMRNASCMIGNSSSGIRETCYFGTPTVNIGTRQKNRERGSNVTDAPYDGEKIYEAMVKQIKHGRYEPEFIYGDGKSGARIADILASIDLSKLEIQKRMTY